MWKGVGFSFGGLLVRFTRRHVKIRFFWIRRGSQWRSPWRRKVSTLFWKLETTLWEYFFNTFLEDIIQHVYGWERGLCSWGREILIQMMKRILSTLLREDWRGDPFLCLHHGCKRKEGAHFGGEGRGEKVMISSTRTGRKGHDREHDDSFEGSPIWPSPRTQVGGVLGR